jgi:hypothetical protein
MLCFWIPPSMDEFELALQFGILIKLEELIHTTQNVFHYLTNKWGLHI